MKQFACHNLGCRVNEYETEVMAESLRDAGFEEVSFEEKADVYVVNTCTVTNIADRKSRQMLHRARKLNPDALVVAVGCYVETDAAGVKKDPAVDIAIGNNRKGEIADIILGVMEERQRGGTPQDCCGGPAEGTSGENAEDRRSQADGNARDDADRRDAAEGCLVFREDLTDHPSFENMALPRARRRRAFIKIQDGCNQFCTYCLTIIARGRIRSRDEEDILREARTLAMDGAEEITLTGIHVASYGVDRGRKQGEALAELLVKLNDIPGIRRIAFGSIEPRAMTPEFIRTLKSLPKVQPHFHLSLQSGCDATLKRMNRHYTAEEYARVCRDLREAYDRPSITTDVIVGFPGETEEEFETTRRYLEKLDLYELHIFRYSVRRGTAAATFPDQVPESVKASRSDVLQEMTCRQSERYRRSFIGETEEIVPEEILTCREMQRRTQNEMAEVKAAGRSEGGSGEFGPSDRFLVGHTGRYVACAVPLDGRKAENGGIMPEETVRGVLGEPVPGTPYLLLTPRERVTLK